jgi:hypothetical protein
MTLTPVRQRAATTWTTSSAAMLAALTSLAAAGPGCGDGPPSVEGPTVTSTGLPGPSGGAADDPRATLPSTGTIADTVGGVHVGFTAQGAFTVDGTRIFPLILSPPPPRDSHAPGGKLALDEVVEGGINFFRTGPVGSGATWSAAALDEELQWHREATQRGAYCWVNLKELSTAAPGSAQESLLLSIVDTLRASPAMAMFKGADEPAWGNVPVDGMKHVYQTVRAHDPDHPMVVIEAPRLTVDQIRPYTAAADVHGVDIYPVSLAGHEPLSDVGVWTRKMVELNAPRPVIMTLQIASRGAWDPDGRFVYPTFRQERFMVYDAIINGAQGLAFFGGNVEQAWTALDHQYGWSWTFWNQVLRRVLAEVGPESPLHPALLHPHTGLGLSADHPGLEVVSRQVGKDVYIIAAKKTAGTARVTFKNLPSTLNGGQVLYEGRRITAHQGTLTDTFSQYDVHVYHFRR